LKGPTSKGRKVKGRAEEESKGGKMGKGRYRKRERVEEGQTF